VKTKNKKLIKNTNQYLVLNTIKNFGPLTIEDMVFHTRLSRPTILNIIKHFISENIIYKSGLAESTVGRQPSLFSLNSKAYYAIGIDFDFPPVRLAISDLNGNLVYTRSWDYSVEDDISTITKVLIENIKISIEESGINKELFLGIGIGLPAIIDISHNTAVKIDRIKEWHNVSIEKRISAEIGLNVYIRNDAHLLGMVEKSLLGNDVKHVIYVVHRSGIGMAAFINDTLYEGIHGNSGYIGHTSININGQTCECGKRGCLELYSSKRAIVAEYERQTKQDSKITFDEMVDRSRKGDDIASAILSEAGKNFGIGISNAIKLFDISNVILGDSVTDENNVFFAAFKQSVEFNTSNYTNEPIRITLGQLKRDAYGLGGCYFILDKFFNLTKPTSLTTTFMQGKGMAINAQAYRPSLFLSLGSTLRRPVDNPDKPPVPCTQ